MDSFKFADAISVELKEIKDERPSQDERVPGVCPEGCEDREDCQEGQDTEHGDSGG
jgi:hypothetical protein